ncbi:hypothetical protein P168DRAFT_43083 [Aspergillus campestris IBT 28561]|uniref:Uncharacterized protein n=1 Tax=Aspergillus campestris (strain IBT 28561) TaxID=1392248 RepID=A0A2I1CX67_ASPC2|nr:uncharacterized protein P168DRAFT_43083 [Aspergillus campestris IBT 28561]PKY02216.1 hypothetical protein P168DRAFT_43083 [Aspergillus campestris IBT 28561]
MHSKTLLCTEQVLKQSVYRTGVPKEMQGERLRKILSLPMIRRTVSSRIPFRTGEMIGASIPGIQCRKILIRADPSELGLYKLEAAPLYRGLMIQDERDPDCYVWNNRKLRKLVLDSTWLGFIWLAKSVGAEIVTNGLRCLAEGDLTGR